MPPQRLLPMRPPTPSVGGPIRSLFQQAGLTPWVDTELAPALFVRVRRGQEVTVTKGGTAEAPNWTITPVTKPAGSAAPPMAALANLIPKKKEAPMAVKKGGLIPLKKKEQSGVLPLIPLVVPMIANGAAKGAQNFQRIDADPWGTATPKSGGLLGGGPGDTAIGFSRVGGIEGHKIDRGTQLDLIDSDGFRVRLPE